MYLITTQPKENKARGKRIYANEYLKKLFYSRIFKHFVLKIILGVSLTHIFPPLDEQIPGYLQTEK